MAGKNLTACSVCLSLLPLHPCGPVEVCLHLPLCLCDVACLALPL